MALTKQQKKEIISDLKDKIDQQKTMVFVDFKGAKVKDIFELRKSLKENDSLFKVSKKTLLRVALEDFNKALAEKVEKLEGELAVIFGFGDEVSPAKEAYNFASDNEKLKILGGFFQDEFIEKEKVIELAKIPSEEQLLGQLVGTMSAPISNFANVLQGNIKGLVCALNAIKENK